VPCAGIELVVVVIVGVAFAAFTALAEFAVVFFELAAVAIAEPPTARAEIAATTATGLFKPFDIHYSFLEGHPQAADGRRETTEGLM